MTDLPTLLVYAHPKNDLPDQNLIQELAARHFSKLTIQKLDMKPGQSFDTWLSGQRNPLLVAGAESRSEWSLLFHRSFISKILKEHKMPVFTAHR